MRPARIFRSRWAALLWAGGVIWTAVSLIGFASPGTSASPDNRIVDATGSEVSEADLAVLRNLIGE